jgi:transcription-repair coupling factor (superfamily II helicase)
MFDAVKIYKDSKIKQHKVKRDLVDFGYAPVGLVNQQGDFAQRGNILDVYPASYQNPVRIELFDESVESIFTFNKDTGKIIDYLSILVVLPVKKNILSRFKSTPLQLGSKYKIGQLNKFYPGDYIVHLKHGIGKFLGIEILKTEDGPAEHLKLLYADNNKLYVPEDKMHMVQKYIAFSDKPPKLYKLGSKRWLRTKKTVQEKLEILAAELLQMQAVRSAISGFTFSGDYPWQKKFEDTFDYTETPDQKRTIDEVKKDMESQIPMDRLICGDVGYGKTEVAFRAAFKAVMDDKQVAVLVPTTILAQQHYNNLKKRIKEFPIGVKVLSRFNTHSKNKKILKQLKEGKVNIVIGTHRLLSDDVNFKDLGLVIIDEEQRFGVRHKEKLKTLRFLVDVLTLTATPIPRTLYMSLMDIKDLSIINTPPEDRLAVQTHVLQYDNQLIRRSVLRELERSGQVYFIHNRIKDIKEVKHKLNELIPEAEVAVAHGRMPAKKLEEVMDKFIDRQIDILLSTNIIESGLDIPNVNTLIVDNAHMFGLSDLYQLKGRIGRFKEKAYCYFMVPPKHIIDTTARKRLQAIEKFTNLGSGFNIAMEDLEIRGAGNLLGPQQHGYIIQVGFDLYCKLLKSTIKRLKESNRQDRIKEKKDFETIFAKN